MKDLPHEPHGTRSMLYPYGSPLKSDYLGLGPAPEAPSNDDLNAVDFCDRFLFILGVRRPTAGTVGSSIVFI